MQRNIKRKPLHLQLQKRPIGKRPYMPTHMDGATANTPNFPGLQLDPGATVEEIRALVKKQIRVKGFAITVDTGTTPFDINLAGNAKMFMGFALGNAEDPVDQWAEQVNLMINNELIIQETHPLFFSNLFMDDEYYYIPRPLSGSDSITMTFENTLASQTFYLAVYYI